MLGSSLFPLQNQILSFVPAHGAKYSVKNVRVETQWKVGLAYVLDETRYFALLSRKWYYHFYSSFPLAESPPNDLQITAYK